MNKTKVPLISKEAERLYKEGLSIDSVAIELGVAYRTVRKALNEAGVVTRDPSARLVGRTRPDKRNQV